MNMNQGRAIACAFLMLCFSAQFATADTLNLQDVLANVAVQPPAKIGFEEQRYNAMLKRPLQLAGTLEYLAPGRLRKTIETPFTESVLIDGQVVELTRDGKTRRLSLKSNRMMQVMLGGIAALLAGDITSLEKNFGITLEGLERDWTLRLVPLNPRLTTHLQQLEIRGDERNVQSILIRFNDEDWQLMRLLPETVVPTQ